jgi:hypothetical protein
MPHLLTQEDKQKFITSIEKQIDGVKSSINLNGKNEKKIQFISSLTKIVDEVKKLSIEDYSNEEAAWATAFRNLNIQHIEKVSEKVC